jgi:hypothetical protein
MRFFPFPTVAVPPPADTAPFLIEHSQILETGEHFTPTARVILATGLRTGGLLAQIPDEAARTLLAMLALVTPNGRIQPDIWELAQILGTSEAEAHARLTRLAELRWQGQPLGHELTAETGRVTGVLSGHLIIARDAPPLPSETSQPAGPSTTAGRDVVITHSRETYGRPRAGVERLVAEQLGHTEEAEEEVATPEGEVRGKLRAYGLSSEEARFLVATYPLERIERQLSWMGMRRALHPARFLRAAIVGDYEPPEYVRRQKDRQYERGQEPQEQQAVDGIETVETIEAAVGEGLDAD